MMKVPGYPTWLEQWWIREACERLSVQNFRDLLPRLEKDIQRLSDRFTISRKEPFADVYEDPNLLLAYGLFFFPQTFVRIQFPITELLSRGWNPSFEKTFRILDLGSGTGSAGICAETMFRQRGFKSIAVISADRSEVSLSLHRKITNELREYFPGTEWKTEAMDVRSLKNLHQEIDLVLISFAIGELFENQSANVIVDWIEDISKRLTSTGIVVVTEPAVQETSVKLEQVRDLVAESRKLHIWGPCLHHEFCPLLREEKFWCHEVRRWNLPISLESLNRHLYRSIHLLKFSFLILGKQPAVPFSEGYFRLVSPVAKMKGKYVAAGCGVDGKIQEYQILKRNLNESTKHSLKELERGDVLKL